MGNYEDAMAEIIEESFHGAKPITRRNPSLGFLEDGFEFEINCKWQECEHHPSANSGCNYTSADKETIRQSGGKCYKFISLEDFWERFSNTHAIDPETGEVYEIY